MVALEEALTFSFRVKDAVQDFAYDNSDIVYTVGVVAIVTGGLMLWARRSLRKNPGEGEKMTKGEYVLSQREQRQQEQNRIADALADGLLTAYTKGEISEDCYQKTHLRLGTQFGFKDLLPVKMTPEQLKAALAKKHSKPRVYKPVPFPKETPKKRFKHALEELLSKI